jgi:psp operon transcriptional activator
VAGQKQQIIGSSECWHQVLQQVSQVAPLNRPILIIGERGTGKELIAERLHYLSMRWQQPYLQVNCAAMQENLLESELFGHEAGAFTGATRSRAGLFERADGGTLFLDELATASLAVQEKLLRIIEYGRFERVGGSKTLLVDVRVVAACNEDLPSLVAQGRFRGDLLDRLAFDVLNLPPLRYRKEDISELAEHFALRMCLELGYDYFSGFTSEAMQH